MRVLLDVNVVLDVLLQRQEWLADAQVIWDAADQGRVECFVGVSSLTDIFYISRRLVGREQARQVVRACLDSLEILQVDRHLMEQAYSRPEGDLEDALQIVLAIANSLDAIVTRDTAGFAEAPLSVWSPSDLIDEIANHNDHA